MNFQSKFETILSNLDLLWPILTQSFSFEPILANFIEPDSDSKGIRISKLSLAGVWMKFDFQAVLS